MSTENVETSLWVLTLGIAMVGCSKAQASDSKLEATAAASATRIQAVERHATAPIAQNPRDIAALFQNEAANRPRGALPADDVLAALRGAGVELNDERQHLARPYGARYCVGAQAGDDLALSVCEYIDAEAAQAGVAVSRKIPLANREINVNRATSLTIRRIKQSASSDELTRRLFRVFANL